MTEMPRVWNRRKGEPKPPPGAVYVGRPTKWGNPYPVVGIDAFGTAHEMAVLRYTGWIMRPEQSALRESMRRELRGKHLVCWCHPLPCHAEVILEIANSTGECL